MQVCGCPRDPGTRGDLVAKYDDIDRTAERLISKGVRLSKVLRLIVAVEDARDQNPDTVRSTPKDQETKRPKAAV